MYLLNIPMWIMVFAWIGVSCVVASVGLVIFILIRRKKPKNEDLTALRIILSGLKELEAEGYTTDHNTKYKSDELAIAASCYLYAPKYPFDVGSGRVAPMQWPLPANRWKPEGGRMLQLQKAGALLIAELERELLKQCTAKTIKIHGTRTGRIPAAKRNSS